MASSLLKAAHVLEDLPPWIFDDPLGSRLLTAAETKTIRSAISRLPSEVYRALRVELAARSRLAEDIAADGVTAGRCDYVLLGAGLGTSRSSPPIAPTTSTLSYTTRGLKQSSSWMPERSGHAT